MRFRPASSFGIAPGEGKSPNDKENPHAAEDVVVLSTGGRLRVTGIRTRRPGFLALVRLGPLLSDVRTFLDRLRSLLDSLRSLLRTGRGRLVCGNPPRSDSAIDSRSLPLVSDALDWLL